MCKELAEEEEEEFLPVKEEPEEEEVQPGLPTIPEDEEEDQGNITLSIPGILSRRVVRNFLLLTALDKYWIKIWSISIKR